MEFISVLARRTSNKFLRRSTTLKEIPQKAIMKLFKRSALELSATDELHTAIIESAEKFVVHVSTWGSTFVGETLEPRYEQLFKDDREHSTHSYFNQLLLATEASCFFLHALNRGLQRFASANFRREIYETSVFEVKRWLMQISLLALGQESRSFTADAFGNLITTRDREYARLPNLLNSESEDNSSAISVAGRKISDEISIKDSFDREGYANHAILTHIVVTVLMLELEALNLSSRVERASETTFNQKLSAYLEPISDQPRRLIESAALCESEIKLPDLILDGTLAVLQARVFKAFFSRSVVFRALARMDRRRKHDHLSSKPASSASPSFNDLRIGHGRNSQ
jgi:hypothetical protein